MRRGYKIALSVILVLIIMLSIVGVHRILNPQVKKEPITIKVLDTISQFDYSINDRDSEYYKEEYEKLKKILEADPIDYEAYSEQVARMFIIDLYSIDTKVNKYDVGGSKYYHSNRKSMHEEKVKNTLYDLVQDDSYGDRDQELPLVTDVQTVSVREAEYKMDEEVVPAYEIVLTWTYKKDLGYDHKGKIIVVKDGIKQSVVSYTAGEEKIEEPVKEDE